ncbi:glucose-1-phosphate thymidylyltransferase [Streptomyces sp. BHT-5-2]|uniref:glucose-1-phosphate thymidylyltransferase n=1 Tax=Streptomyces sp. BHT-5-2 TaxID=2866715 RepID=UPI001C8D26C9|nr:glucose-1-phosphate thymidylyltransferase [Streptomyces sp. BHT-5-2]QZL06405.1 glucose-1-phosphate thymidylyltransferase [Streptomyces sp. BHT-5-2]
MKALVLAGGAGTRLRPITHTSAKQLVPVANKPVLFYGLEAIAAAGITDVGVIVGDTAGDIRKAVGDGSRFGLQITYIPQDRPGGLAHAVLVARAFLADQDFLMYLGDTFVDGGVPELVDAFRRERPDAMLLLARVEDPSAFGVAVVDDRTGRVHGLEEKPAVPKSDQAIAGVYAFTPAIHRAVDSIVPSARGELEITGAIQWLIDEGRQVGSLPVRGFWKDTGNIFDILEANRLALEGLQPCIDGAVDAESQIVGRVHIEAGATVCRSRIVGPAVIGRDAAVIDSYVGPYTSLAEQSSVVGSGIEYSIMLRGASLEGVHRIEGSLIGHEVEVRPAPRMPAAHRLFLGDHSKVQISS